MSSERDTPRDPGHRRDRENRLARSSSPYLLQHARNPVDWFPWGDEAFALARSRNVPIFVSVGYSTCYWCHVMERESFEDQGTAALMNERFVCVKVDREERPDVDEVLMAATVLMTGHGGWPMSVFLEPDTLRPFWCGTYFPKEPRFAGRPTFRQVLTGLSAAYAGERESVRTQAQRLAEAVTQQLAGESEPAPLDAALVETALSRLLAMLDSVQGGFGTAPKFPQPVFLEFLLDVREMAGDTATRDAIERAVRLTLDKMALGGIHDQVGGGFHRYSVDATWTVPHFEKMLYDNAQLLSVYARAARAFDDPLHARTARRVIAYLRREMTDPGGGWWSAQDAEVHAREGLNYLWTPAQVQAALEDDLAAFACAALSIQGEPNFQDPHHQGEPGAWVARLSARPELLAARMLLSDREFSDRLARACDGLLEARASRDQPGTDDKVLACWNGLMVASLASASRELDQPELLREALAAFSALTRRLLRPDGLLLRGVRHDTPAGPGFLEDSAAMLLGAAAIARELTSPDDARERARVLDVARSLYSRAREDFAQGDLWHDTRADAPDLFVRSRSTHDGAVPSGFSMLVHAMLDLWEVTGDEAFRRDATRALAARSGDIAHSPVGAINAVRAIARLLRAGAPDLPTLPARGAPQSGSHPGASAADGVVEVYASVDRIPLQADQPASFTLALAIAPGYHVIAASPTTQPSDDPAVASLLPLRVGVINGAGVKAYADYPQGEPFSIPGGVLPEVLVHQGRVEFTVALEREGDWSGRPLLFVRFQACSDDACLPPTTVELDIALDRV